MYDFLEQGLANSFLKGQVIFPASWAVRSVTTLNSVAVAVSSRRQY